ncbi:MAG TPA: sigma-70 family RNA polymerase sigma factor [Thermoanaerobaculia bacterium]|nr:sigma-70 family RNA polymerase sigma factor [Thermoanaerobaculia bacterium]
MLPRGFRQMENTVVELDTFVRFDPLPLRPPTLSRGRGEPVSEAATPLLPSDLVSRIMAGDRGAEAELVEHFGEGLVFLLRRWTRDRTTAEDLYQETLRLALEKIRQGEVRQPEKLSGYLRSLAKNLATHHYRRGSTREDRERELDETVATVPAGDTMEPLTRLLQAEKAGLVRRLIGELASDRDRQVLFRFYIAEEAKERICADLGLTSPEFNVVLFRARQRYRKLFEERLGGRGQ